MSSSEIVSTDPCTGEVVWRGPASAPGELDDALARARQGFAAWAALPLAERHAAARRFADLAKAR
uniref:aldehyde dehydrogenase family protein n=1 Tax=Phenylobacterium sp. TaxID=1871053 RepID=UPI0035ADCC6B